MRLERTQCIAEFVQKMNKTDNVQVDRIVSSSPAVLRRYLNENGGEIEEILVIKKMKGGKR